MIVEGFKLLAFPAENILGLILLREIWREHQMVEVASMRHMPIRVFYRNIHMLATFRADSRNPGSLYRYMLRYRLGLVCLEDVMMVAGSGGNKCRRNVIVMAHGQAVF